MTIDHLAFDIETVPAKELSDYSPLVQEKIGEKVARIQERNPNYDYNQFASIHGDFNKIICISMGYIINEGKSAGQAPKIKLKSFSGDDEQDILSKFNEVIHSFSGIFIHYNGLNFDAITIIQRMAHHDMTPLNRRFTNLRRYSTEPHFDVMMQYYNWDLQRALPLGVLAELHQIPSPKDDLSGDKVLDAYRKGEWERIVRYCEFDVATTLNLWNKIFRSQPIIPPDDYEFSE
jgi:predicted PolB exonuclease-like 3'-5' exonuclease